MFLGYLKGGVIGTSQGGEAASSDFFDRLRFAGIFVDWVNYAFCIKKPSNKQSLFGFEFKGAKRGKL